MGGEVRGAKLTEWPRTRAAGEGTVWECYRIQMPAADTAPLPSTHPTLRAPTSCNWPPCALVFPKVSIFSQTACRWRPYDGHRQ